MTTVLNGSLLSLFLSAVSADAQEFNADHDWETTPRFMLSDMVPGGQRVYNFPAENRSNQSIRSWREQMDVIHTLGGFLPKWMPFDPVQQKISIEILNIKF